MWAKWSNFGWGMQKAFLVPAWRIRCLHVESGPTMKQAWCPEPSSCTQFKCFRSTLVADLISCDKALRETHLRGLFPRHIQNWKCQWIYDLPAQHEERLRCKCWQCRLLQAGQRMPLMGCTPPSPSALPSPRRSPISFKHWCTIGRTQ